MADSKKAPYFLVLDADAQHNFNYGKHGWVPFPALPAAAARLNLVGTLEPDGKFHVNVDCESLGEIIGEYYKTHQVSIEEASAEIERVERRIESCRKANPFGNLEDANLGLHRANDLLNEFVTEGRTQFLPVAEAARAAAESAEEATVASLQDIAQSLLEQPLGEDLDAAYVELDSAFYTFGPRGVALLKKLCDRLRTSVELEKLGQIASNLCEEQALGTDVRERVRVAYAAGGLEGVAQLKRIIGEFATATPARGRNQAHGARR